MIIVNMVPDAIGWSPIRYMAALASELLDAEQLTVDEHAPSTINKALSILNRRTKHGNGTESCLMICSGPPDLAKILNIQNWRKRFRFLAAWVIDSFWVDHFPSSIRLSSPFDHFFVTSMEDVDLWGRKTGVPTTWLPWGTDAFRLGGGSTQRDWDITRVGRQPPEWDNDAAASEAAKLLGIKYGGRPSRAALTSSQNLEFLMNIYGNSKYILAFSNSVNPEKYTHPTRQYLTGRWVDALGCGAVVAGIAPRGPGIDDLLWPGATLDLGSIRRSEGLEVLASALRKWTPDTAVNNFAMALKILDWRWRFKVLADVCGISSVPLAAELKLLQNRIGAAA